MHSLLELRIVSSAAYFSWLAVITLPTFALPCRLVVRMRPVTFVGSLKCFLPTIKQRHAEKAKRSEPRPSSLSRALSLPGWAGQPAIAITSAALM
jgi:hypothetical protein